MFPLKRISKFTQENGISRPFFHRSQLYTSVNKLLAPDNLCHQANREPNQEGCDSTQETSLQHSSAEPKILNTWVGFL